MFEVVFFIRDTLCQFGRIPEYINGVEHLKFMILPTGSKSNNRIVFRFRDALPILFSSVECERTC